MFKQRLFAGSTLVALFYGAALVKQSKKANKMLKFFEIDIQH